MLFTTLTSSSWDASVDLRSQMQPVRYQGERNTCSVFAATSLMEFLIKKETGKDLDLSEQYNYWTSKNKTLNNNTLQFYSAVDGLPGYLALEGYKYGSALESQWPYEAQNPMMAKDPKCLNTNQPSSDCFTGVPSPKLVTLPYKIKTSYIDRNKIGEFLLKQKTPVLVNIKWCYQAVDAKGDFHMPNATELAQCGGHVIALVGYDSETKRFTFRNSWGATWGNLGYGTLPEDYLMQHCEVCENLKYLDQYNAEERELVLNTSRGVTGTLIISEQK